MLIGKVTGNIWATRKQEGLNGFKLMIVELINPNEETVNCNENDASRRSLVAVDTVGAGIGDTVLISRGGAARRAILPSQGPVDEAIVGIVDNMEVF